MLTMLRHQTAQVQRSRAVLGLVLASAVSSAMAPPSCSQDDSQRGQAERTLLRDDSVDPELAKKWVEDLGNDNYRRRESAARNLIQAGNSAVPYVAPSLESGDLETTNSAIHILHEIALAQSHRDKTGAWYYLQQLAQEGSGSRQTRAAEAVEEIHEFRSAQAAQALRKSGIYIGPDEFVIRAISTQKQIVQIDENWNGDVEAIGWLRWLRGVEHARVKGPAISADVLEQLSETADLTTIAIVDGTITPDTIKPLQKMIRIHSLEFRYVALDEAMVQPIMELPIRVSLSLTGTGIPRASVDVMREALPGLQIDQKEGGFLGVTCLQSFNDCQIQGVQPDSAADQAGLMPMDIVTGIDDEPVERFEDLQQAIGMHFPGDKVTVKFRRGGQEKSVVVTLGKLKER